MIQGWTSKRQYKRQNSAHAVWREQQVIFPVVRGGASLRGNVVVTGLLGHYRSQRIFIDPGSNSDIMFEQCFNLLDNEDKARLQPVNGTIAGFINETIQPMGHVSFPVTLTDGKHTRVEVLDFLVIPSTSHHDVLLGQDAKQASTCPSPPRTARWDSQRRQS